MEGVILYSYTSAEDRGLLLLNLYYSAITLVITRYLLIITNSREKNHKEIILFLGYDYMKKNNAR